MVIFVLTRDTILFIRQVLPSTLRKTIDEFRRTITPYVDTGIFNEFCRISYILYNQFVKPISVLGSLNRLVILPDQELGFLPFETFITDTLKPRSSDFRRLNYLNRKYQISYISSHQQFYLQRLYASLKEPAIIFSFAPFHKEGAKIDTLDLVALANSGEELKEIAKLFKTRIFWDKQAGEESLRKALMLNSVINISSHGIIDPEHPLRSRLFLNPAEPDGSLYLFEMMSLKINSPLVILNACNTGTGQLQVGEGILSMARGFQLAGVSSVITTLWPVDDQSSGKIIGSFFKNMHGGMDQREALMTAKNRFIAEATMAGSAPYFWAGQILIGDTQKINIANRKDPLLTFILVGLGALILALIGILYKKVR
jgi:CHAT domain-containing protein